MHDKQALESIRVRVKELMSQASQPGLTAQQRSQIMTECNMLWSKLATLQSETHTTAQSA